MKLLTYIFGLSLVLSTQTLSSANAASDEIPNSSAVSSHSFVQQKDIFGTRVFIQNKGQFDKVLTTTQSVLYALDNGEEKIYFTSTGLTYVFVEAQKNDEEQMEALEQNKKIKQHKPKRYEVNMHWAGANSTGIRVIAALEQSHYITYGEAELNSKAFKKLTYLNVYPGIDIEYTIPEDKENGIKYNLIVHPGANPQDVKILYSGNVKKIKANKSGDMTIRSSLAGITEHRPLSYHRDGTPVGSDFLLHGDTIAFRINGEYNKNKTLIIDPWVTTINASSTNNSAFDVDYDYAGNTYIYGGNSPCKVSKYSAAGSLLWTFSGLISSINWYSQPFGYVGNFCVNKYSGKLFIGQGVNTLGSQIVRLDNSGNYDNFVSTANSNYQEVWDMGFHCSTGSVFSLGGGHNTNTSAATISYTSPALSLSTFQPTNTVARQDIASHCVDDSGHVFVLYSTAGNPSLNNQLCRVNSTFNGNVWTQPSGFANMAEAFNKLAYMGLGSSNSNGYNSLAVNSSYLFYYDGANLAAYAKNTGSMVATTTLNLNIKKQGGIAVDECNTIYLGGNGAILPYSFNGSTFTALSPISLSITATNPYVYDIKLKKSSKQLYICGNGFVAYYSLASTSTCQAAPSACVYTLDPVYIAGTTITCNSPASATVFVTTANTSYTYAWLPSGQTGSVASALTAGLHSVVATNTETNETYTASIYFAPVPVITASISATSSLTCYGINNGTATVLNPGGGQGTYTFLWSSVAASYTSQTVSGLAAGNYVVMVSSPYSPCPFTHLFSIVQPPPLTLTLTAASPTACAGLPVYLAAFCSGGSPFQTPAPPYLHQWLNGPNTNLWFASQNNAGIYTYYFTATDSKSCTVSDSIQLSVLPNPVLLTANAMICVNDTTTLAVSGAATYTWNTGATTNTISCSPPATTHYTVTGTLQGCNTDAIITLVVNPLPVLSIKLSPSPTVCVNSPLKLEAEGAYTYQWHTPQGYYYSGPLLELSPENDAYTGYFKLKGRSTYFCESSDSIYITMLNAPDGAINPDALFACVPYCKTWTFTPLPSTKLPYTISWDLDKQQFTGSSFNHCISRGGAYTLLGHMTDANGCKNELKFDVNAMPRPIADFAYYPTEAVENTDEVRFTNLSQGDNLYSFEWSSGKISLLGDSLHSFAFNTAKLFTEAGTYPISLLVTNDWGCSDTIIKTVRILEDENVYIPNTFTPNNDGLNDTFLPVFRGTKAMRMSVFDRWGEQIFTGNDMTTGWNGKTNGRICQEDIYIWKLELTLNTGIEKALTGIVTLLK